MHIVGTCDFCSREFRHEGLLVSDRGESKKEILERQYEYEYNAQGYTGWYRCVGGRMADG